MYITLKVLNFIAGFLLAILEKVGAINTLYSEDGKITIGVGTVSAGYQNFIICIEMFFAAAGLWFAFPYKIYTSPVRTKSMDKVVSMQSISNNLCETISPRDIVTDAVHNFSPQYQQYIQQVVSECILRCILVIYSVDVNFIVWLCCKRTVTHISW